MCEKVRFLVQIQSQLFNEMWIYIPRFLIEEMKYNYFKIQITMAYLFDNFYKIFKDSLSSLINDYRSCEIPEDVRTRRLDGVQIAVTTPYDRHPRGQTECLTYSGWYKKRLMISSRPLSWLKKTNKLQWTSQLLCCNLCRGDTFV